MDKKILVLLVFILAIGLIVQLTIAAKGGIPGRAPKALKECRDEIDNDGDGNIDWPNDTGCGSKNDNDETDCGDGVCEGGETSETCPEDCGIPDSCSDTDGGNIITVFGTTSGYLNEIYYSHDDYCVDADNIMEYYCSGNYEESQEQSCGTDEYGSNYCNGSSVYIDYTDYFCSSGECDYTVTPELVETCVDPYECVGGECVIPDSCSDTDGGIYIFTQGTISGYQNENSYSYTDTCINNVNLTEYYCSETSPSQTIIPCVNATQCINGACV